MRRLIRKTLSDFSYNAIRLTNGTAPGVRILTYHRVTDAHPEDRLCVPVARFHEQMRMLHESGHRTVRLGRLVEWITRGQGIPSRSVAITLDDGFEDNFLHAAPALTRYGFTACFFVPTGFIQFHQTGSTAPEDRPMSWVQLAALLSEGHEVGAHSVTHRKLTLIPPEELRLEIRGSKEILEHRLKRPVEFFCYPSGDYDQRVRSLVRESGYLGACSVKPGSNGPDADPFGLRRTEVSAFDSIWDFKKKLAGAYDWLHAAVQAVSRP